MLAKDSLYRSVGLAGLSDTERRKILQSADTMQLVILGCVNDVLGQAQIRDGGTGPPVIIKCSIDGSFTISLGSEVSDREGRGEEGEEGEGEDCLLYTSDAADE